jgi:hypothetical protein
VGALARGCGAAEAADDGELRQQRSSDEAWHSERRKRSRMGVCVELKDMLQVEEEARRARAGVGKLAACVAARAVAVRRGGAGRGPAWGGERRARRWRARGVEKSGAGQLGLGKAAGEGGGVPCARQSRRDWR